MRTEKKEINSTTMELKIILEKEEVDKLYNKTVKYFRNKYAIPGFRKGKAPLSMVKKMFKEAIDASFELAAADEYLNQALLNEKENPINEPELLSYEWNDNGEYEMVFKFEIMPKIDVKKYKNLEVEYVEEKLTDEHINSHLEQLRNEYATTSQITENIQEHDIFDLLFYDNKEDEKPLFEIKNIHYHAENFPEEFNKFIQTAKENDTIAIKLDPSKFTNQIPENFDTKKEYIVKISNIKRIEKPNLDDDFAKDLNFESLDDLKKNLAKDFEKQLDEKNREAKITAVKVKIIEENPFDVPKSVIDNYSKELAGSYVKTKEELDKIIPLFNSMAEFNIKNYLIKNDIVKKEKLELTDEDLENYNKKKAEKLSMDLEKFKELYKSTIEKDSYKDQVLEEKYNNFLLENNKVIPTVKAKDDTETQPKEEKIEEKEKNNNKQEVKEEK